MMWVLILLAIVAAAPFLREALRAPMDAKARATAPGQFARLPQGVTHYQWYGPENGPVVVCVHGLTTPSFVWNSIAPALAGEGYRVLTYDLYGRGYSDRPKGHQDPAFFAAQLDALLSDQNVEGDFALIGYSMGGAIGASYTAIGSRPVKQLVLLAPGGMQPVGSPALQRMVQMPVVGRWLMMARYPTMLRRGLRAEADQPSSIPDINALQHAELGFRGFVPAVHESLLGMLTESFQTYHEKINQQRTPVLSIWGAQDDVIPLSAKDTLTQWNPDAMQHIIPNAGHGLTYSHTVQVLDHILRFLSRDP
ncbi:MAG: alpha/beta hydrolase [Roseobacter sp.]